MLYLEDLYVKQIVEKFLQIMFQIGYVYRRLKAGHRLSEFQKLSRLNWCLRNINNDFENYLFVDETTVRVMEVPLYHVRLPNQLPESIPLRSKLRLKLNVWGGISLKGACPFVVS